MKINWEPERNSIHCKLGVIVYKWKILIERPHLLVIYNYYDLLVKYVERFKKQKLSNIVAISTAIRENKIEHFKYLLGVLPKNVEDYLIYDILPDCGKYGRIEFIKHIKSTSMIKGFMLYEPALRTSPLSGDIEFVEWLLDMVEKYFYKKRRVDLITISQTLMNVAKQCSVEIMKLFMKREYFWYLNLQYLVWYTIPHGHLEFLKFLDSETTIIDYIKQLDEQPQYIDLAVKHNHFHILQWLQENSIGSANIMTMDQAAKLGNLPMVQYLHNNRTEGCTYDAMENASANNHFEVLKWLHFNSSAECTTGCMDKAARNSLEMVMWLHENRSEGCTSNAMTNAISMNRLDIVEFLHFNRTEGCKSDSLEIAAHKNNFEMVKWLHNNRIECKQNSRAIDYAAQHNLEMVIWFHENRTEPFTNSAFTMALNNNRLDILKFLLENKKFDRVDGDLLCSAAKTGNLDLIKYIYENKIGKIQRNDEYVMCLCHNLIHDDFNDILLWLISNSEINSNNNIKTNNDIYVINLKKALKYAKRYDKIESMDIIKQFYKEDDSIFSVLKQKIFK